MSLIQSLIHESHDYLRGGTQKETYTRDDVEEVACPLCGADEPERIYLEYDILGICRCGRCDLIYTSPRLKAPEAIYWGDAADYLEEARLVFSGQRPHHRDPNYLEELRLVERYRRPGRFLDVGCNMGMLLRLARERGWDAVGVEPSRSLGGLAREKLGLTVHEGFLEDFSPDSLGRFDVVAMSDVLEHVARPLPLLRHAHRFLAEGGVLFVKVPNARWNLFKQRVSALGGRAPRQGIWDSYEHVVHYTSRTLRRMLETAGLETLCLTVGKPVQVPAWHRYVGQYYQYPSPWCLDWKRHAGRSACFWLSVPERWLRGGRVGYLAPNLMAVARLAA
ncbi:MAG: class I SAM-dependent methyltransferase [Gemmatimonadetes bacterium]|nr:class I SAM-dependent methyltransferase [Gemmatimonadota bacterium]